MASTAWPMETPGARLNESVTAGICACRLMVSGPTLRRIVAIWSSGIRAACVGAAAPVGGAPPTPAAALAGRI